MGERRSRTWPRLAGMLAGVMTLAAPSVAATEPFNCLPPKDCDTEAKCCSFPHDSLFKFQMEDVRVSRDWYGDPCNMAWARKKAKELAGDDTSGFFYAKWGAILRAEYAKDQEEMDKILAKDVTADDAKNHNENDTGGSTDPQSCKPKYNAGKNFEHLDTCQEFIDATKAHEEDHASFCTQMHSDPKFASQWGDPTGAKATAESERRAHAKEYAKLLKGYEEAHRRCSKKRKKLDPDTDRKSKQKVKKAQQSYKKGGGGSCSM